MDTITVIDAFFSDGAPSRETYFRALCEEALRLGRMTEAEYTALCSAMMELLAQRILLFTDGESTAVREETAKRILSSIVYNIGIALLKAGSHGAALEKMQSVPLSILHDAGMRITMRTRTRAEVLALLMRRVCAGRQLSRGFHRFVMQTAYEYVRQYDPLYGSAETLPVRLDEMGIRESVCGIMRLAEIMTEVIRKYHKKMGTAQMRYPKDYRSEDRKASIMARTRQIKAARKDSRPIHAGMAEEKNRYGDTSIVNSPNVDKAITH